MGSRFACTRTYEHGAKMAERRLCVLCLPTRILRRYTVRAMNARTICSGRSPNEKRAVLFPPLNCGNASTGNSSHQMLLPSGNKAATELCDSPGAPDVVPGRLFVVPRGLVCLLAKRERLYYRSLHFATATRSRECAFRWSIALSSLVPSNCVITHIFGILSANDAILFRENASRHRSSEWGHHGNS